MAPMTKEEYEKQQSVMRRVFDPDTGRYRYLNITCLHLGCIFCSLMFLENVQAYVCGLSFDSFIYDMLFQNFHQRLIKGDGEIMEECVSYSRHKEINKVRILSLRFCKKIKVLITQTFTT